MRTQNITVAKSWLLKEETDMGLDGIPKTPESVTWYVRDCPLLWGRNYPVGPPKFDHPFGVTEE